MPEVLHNAVARPLAGRNYLSYSALKTYQGCPLRYFFKYVAGLPEETVAASLLFGSAMHASLEAHFRGLMIGMPVSLDELLGVFWESWSGRQAQRILFGSDDANSIGEAADRMLKTFLRSPLAKPEGTVLGIEEEMRGPVRDGMPDLLARLDLVVDTGDAVKISDFKTARSQWDDARLGHAADQLLLYSELLRPLTDGRPVKLEFIVLTKTKVPQVSVHPLAYDWHQVERTKGIAKHVWDAIQGGHFYPNPSFQCATCPFRTPCAHWEEPCR